MLPRLKKRTHSECFKSDNFLKHSIISVWCSYASLKLVHDIGSSVPVCIQQLHYIFADDASFQLKVELKKNRTKNYTNSRKLQ